MWSLDPAAPLPLWRPDTGPRGVVVAFSTRRGGVSEAPFESLNVGRSTPDRPEAVRENRRRMLVALGLAPERVATAGQVHGAAVSEVHAPGHTPDCDALFTRERDMALAVTTADCLPIAFVAPGAVAVAHSGWRGTAAGIPGATLRSICAAAGVSPGAVSVYFGPCIRACCYEVGPEVAARFPGDSCRREGERHRLDLAAAARLQLLESGVSPASIHDTAACTCCTPELYFSYRRDGDPSGRHWALVAMTV